ncbi:MAG: hypothetical protein HYS04_18910 [Acidobacteria bacterium]|nr:hypothetical protein [Acidobacteriota bacterium]
MNRRIEALLRAVVPYRYLAAARLAQLRLTGHTDYYERTDRERFFYNAFKLLWKNRISGDYCEFGSNGAMTFVLAYYASRRFQHPALAPRILWSFDSFQGLPPQKGPKDEHPEWVQGWLKTEEPQFHRILKNAGVPRSAYRTVAGFYEDTIGHAATRRPAELPSDIALAYIDCDLYSSTMSVLEFLAPRVKHGMIIACDDYFLNSASAGSGERMALFEVFAQDGRWNLLPYLTYGYAGVSFIVEDRALVGINDLPAVQAAANVTGATS